MTQSDRKMLRTLPLMPRTTLPSKSKGEDVIFLNFSKFQTERMDI